MACELQLVGLWNEPPAEAPPTLGVPLDASVTRDRGVEILDQVEQFLGELEQRWSRFISTSDISRLNAMPGECVAVGPHTVSLLEAMIEAWVYSDGLCDCGGGDDLLELGYTHTFAELESVPPALRSSAVQAGDSGASPRTVLSSGSAREFTPRAIRPSLARLEVNPLAATATLPQGIRLDPGAIGKGLAADFAVSQMLMAGFDGALVSIGGDLVLRGVGPGGGPDAGRGAGCDAGPGAAGWLVDIEDPFDLDNTIVTLSVSEGAVCTSSTLSRRWKAGSRVVHHVIDPRTGVPAETDLVSVSVVAPNGLSAEASATAALILGSEAGLDWLEDRQLTAVAVTNQGVMRYTSDLVGGGYRSQDLKPNSTRQREVAK
jgi:thiamine biosynthesis lipoprotein